MNRLRSLFFIFLLATLITSCSQSELNQSIDTTQNTDENEIIVDSNPLELNENTHIIKDSLAREIVVPKEVNRIAATYAATGHILALLGEGDKIVAVNGGLKRDKLLNLLVPSIQNAAVPRQSGKINVEELARVKPDVILINKQTFQDSGQIKKLNQLKIPFLVIDFHSIEEQKEAIKFLGKLVDKTDQANQYIEYYQEKIDFVSAKTKIIPEDKKIKVYHSINEATRTDVPNTLPYEWLQKVGADIVSGSDELRKVGNDYFASIEQILLWNPEVIIVNEDGVDEYIKSKPQWKNIDAVMNNKVYLLPNGLTRWGHPGSIEIPLASLWTAKILYPEHFPELDMKEVTRDFYETFFALKLSEEQISDILSGKDMRIPKEGKKSE